MQKFAMTKSKVRDQGTPQSNLATSELQIFLLHAWTIFMRKYAADYIWCLLIITAGDGAYGAGDFHIFRNSVDFFCRKAILEF